MSVYGDAAPSASCGLGLQQWFALFGYFIVVGGFGLFGGGGGGLRPTATALAGLTGNPRNGYYPYHHILSHQGQLG